MSQNSNRLHGDMTQLLTRIDERNVLATFGFVRRICLEDIPPAIIHFCVVYAFLKVNEWLKGGDGWNIDETKSIAFGNETVGEMSTIYANPIISSGKHEWKIKISSIGDQGTYSSYVYIGIATSMHCLDQHFFGYYGGAADCGAKNYVFLDFHMKMSHKIEDAVNYPKNNCDGKEYRCKDEVLLTVHLDMDERIVGFSLDDKFLGVAYNDIDDGEYRLAISMMGRKNRKYEFIQ